MYAYTNVFFISLKITLSTYSLFLIFSGANLNNILIQTAIYAFQKRRRKKKSQVARQFFVPKKRSERGWGLWIIVGREMCVVVSWD